LATCHTLSDSYGRPKGWWIYESADAREAHTWRARAPPFVVIRLREGAPSRRAFWLLLARRKIGLRSYLGKIDVDGVRVIGVNIAHAAPEMSIVDGSPTCGCREGSQRWNR
jgi:hypothetical protein